MCKLVSIDLVCLSFYLADMDGIDLVAEIRGMEFGETIPVLMITSKESQDAVAKSLRDQLTGLYKRRYLIGLADKVLGEAFRYRYPVSLLVIDLDHFKRINDTHGHATGDKVLKALAGLPLRTFRGSDIPVRFGGEEFVVLMSHCSDQDAINRARNLCLTIAGLKPAGIDTTASIGVTQTPSDTLVAYTQLFAVADEAVYAAKNSSRNCVVFRELHLR